MILRPDAEPQQPDKRYSRLQAEATFYRGATILLLVVALLEGGVLVWQTHRARFARAIRIEGQVACFVGTAGAAQEVHKRLLADRKGDLPGEAVLEQRWEDLNWPLESKDKVLSVNAAVELLKSRVSAKVAAVAIQVGKRNLVVMPTEELAKLALDTLKSQYAGADAKEAYFLQKDVFTPATQAHPASVVKDVGKAVGILRNPPVGTTKLVVVVVKEERREVTYQLPPERLLTNTVARGVTRAVSQNVPGKKAITEKVTYHNGKRVASQKVAEKVLQPAVAERVMVGTAAPAGEAAAPPG